jgi:hypothetical protein
MTQKEMQIVICFFCIFQTVSKLLYKKIFCMHAQASTFMCALYSFLFVAPIYFTRSLFYSYVKLYIFIVLYTHRLDSHESLLESFVSDCAYLQVQTQFHAILKARTSSKILFAGQLYSC